MAEQMSRCPAGHFYEPSQHSECPWCNPNQHIQAARASDEAAGVAAAAAPAAAPESNAAIPSDLVGDAVVGWLVCLEGPDRGRDFRLRAEKNFIGRSPNMDVCIAGDEAVSRERHGAVFFDPHKQTFWVTPGDAAGVVYLNGEILRAPAQLKRDDVIELGRTKLVLIPFCDGTRSWTADASVHLPQSGA